MLLVVILRAANADLEAVWKMATPPRTPASSLVSQSSIRRLVRMRLALGPSGAHEFTLSAIDGDKLGFVTIFIPSNDWYYTPTDTDNSLDLFVGGQPISGEVVASDIAIWDAGTEVDEEPGTGTPVRAKQWTSRC